MRSIQSNHIASQPTFPFHISLSNPGQLYNVGNAVAVLGSVVHCILLSQLFSNTALPNFGSYFFGSWPSLCTSLAVTFFFVSGQKYALAWSKGFPPLENANNMGHALSALGAILVGAGLAGLSQNAISLMLALTATILHASGKLGSWQLPKHDLVFKVMPLISRLPYIATLGLDVAAALHTNVSTELAIAKVALPMSLLAATLFWAKADWALLTAKK
jgi:hypothetical protein